MSIPQPVRRQFYAFRALAILLVVFAGATFALAPHSFAIHSLGAAAILVSVWVIRISNARVRRARGQTSGWAGGTSKRNRPGPVAWTLGVASIIAAGISYLLMYNDALHGGKQAWPAELFAGVGIACMIIWGYLTVKILR